MQLGYVCIVLMSREKHLPCNLPAAIAAQELLAWRHHSRPIPIHIHFLASVTNTALLAVSMPLAQPHQQCNQANRHQAKNASCDTYADTQRSAGLSARAAAACTAAAGTAS
jgi:hypothetical protein